MEQLERVGSCKTDGVSYADIASGKAKPNQEANVLSPVKSTAILKYPMVEPTVCYLQLRRNTDLNSVPTGDLIPQSSLLWQRLRSAWSYPETQKMNPLFSSFQIANGLTEYVGEVDVISDSENIKKLLQMPYSESHISMIVHRIDKTLFLDEFDVHSYLLRDSKQQWKWLSKFFREVCISEQQHLASGDGPHNDISRGAIEANVADSCDSVLFNRFLQCSLSESMEQSADVPEEGFRFQSRSRKKDRKRSGSSPQVDVVQPSSPEKHRTSGGFAILPDGAPENSEGSEAHGGTGAFLRNVLWTFEDIRMLIGSNMPIFGGGTRPAVSLRLREMDKPINILTGLDYWLDNLMCNVPEVVMCYHLDGIVKKYERFKTEQLPYLGEKCNFSPKLVKDIAQNVLSFLKSKAAKSGHTYWLFKGKKDDVVKLYDLTTLCQTEQPEEGENPFALPVAILLYRVASSLKEGEKPNRRRMQKIYKLLKNSLILLDKSKHLQLAVSAHSQLSDLVVPSDFDPSRVNEDPSEAESTSSGSMMSDDEFDDLSTEEELDDTAVTTVSELSLPPRKPTVDGKSKKEDPNEKIPCALNDWRCRAKLSLHHIMEAVSLIIEHDRMLLQACNKTRVEDESEIETTVEARMACSYEPIPLRYAPIYPQPGDTENNEILPLIDLKQMQLSTSLLMNKSSSVSADDTKSQWRPKCLQFLLQKAAQCFCTLAESHCSKSRYRLALRFIRVGFMCHEELRVLSTTFDHHCSIEPLVYLLGLAGDAYLMMVQYKDAPQDEPLISGEVPSEEIITNAEALLRRLGSSKNSAEWIQDYDALGGGCQDSVDIEVALSLSARCYATALHITPRGTSDSDKIVTRLTSRLGNISNELGVFYMNKASRMLQNDPNSKVERWFDKSQECLDRGLRSFEATHDVVNQALLCSNTGRLMRMRAHAADLAANRVANPEFSQEEHSYYQAAIQCYERALRGLGSRERYTECWDSVNWELCTTFLTMGTLLQDCAPLSSRNRDDVEQEVVAVLKKAEKLCMQETSVSRQPLYQYRLSTIYHRLASLYHNTCRTLQFSLEDSMRCRHFAKKVQMSGSYYEKSAELLISMEHNQELLSLILEHCCLINLAYTKLANSSYLRKQFTLLSQASECLSSAGQEEEQESADDADSLKQQSNQKVAQSLFVKQLQSALLLVIKMQRSQTDIKGKRQAHQEQTAQEWKQVYSDSLRLGNCSDLSVEVKSLMTRVNALVANNFK